jgi:disulfide bond formation protein DsbB|tara:strand:- start:2624 stop:3109 length:486 start_codon:yes stop_codon:yes gene_type:complete
MNNLQKEKYLQILFILSISILLVAYAIQYILGYQPCNLCIIERIPYALAIIILILSYIFRKDHVFYTILLLLNFSFSFLISIYHLGIEQGFFDQSSVCISKNIDLMIKEDILKSLQELSISCKDVAFKIFGLSLTSYNMIASLIMLLITTKIYLINNDLKK